MTHAGTTGKSSTGLLSVMMFLQFFVWGAWYVSQTGFMADRGMSSLIAWAYSVGPIAAIVSPFFLGMVVDRFFPAQKVMAVLHIVGALVMAAIPSISRPAIDGEIGLLHPYILALLVHMLCYMPTLALTNTVALTCMSNPEKQFPLIRVWGTIGWIVANIVVGGNLKDWGIDLTWIAQGDKSPLQFYITAGTGLTLGLFSLMLPHTPPPLAGKKPSVGEILGADALSLLKDRSYLVFIICSFLLCIPLAGYYVLGRNYVEFTGFKSAMITMSYGQMSEILFMLLMPLCFARLGVKWMLAIGMLAWILRYALFAGAADSKVLWMVLGGVALHGICYDFFFVTGQLYVDRAAPTRIRGQAQGFLVLVTQGLGMLIGAQAIGWWVARNTSGKAPDPVVLDWKNVWIAPAAFAAAILVVFVLTFRETRKPINGQLAQ